MLEALPIDPVLPEILERLRRDTSLVLEAPPGAGKTTRLPPALLAIVPEGEILVLEPRRLAARLAARRVAEELGEEPGATVGWAMRFDTVGGPSTRIRFVTEGVLGRRLVAEPTLPRVAAVLLDEFHERHVQSDVALALLRRLQRGARPDLRVVVMSATLDAAPIAAYLGAHVVRAEGRRFEVEIEHLERAEERSLESQVASAVRRLVDEGLDGDVLVFLPGAAEIRRATEACRAVAERADLLVLPLYGSLSPAEQDRATRRADRRKVILSTNVAESSVTIDGVAAVIDSGLARVASHAPWSGLPALKVARISRASAAQRAGRAGRTRAGRCLRLYTRGDLAARPEHDAPEIARVDLADHLLELFAAGVASPSAIEWLDAPPTAAVDAALALLDRLGAIEGAPGGHRVTAIGRRLLRFPLHPRAARMVVEAERRGVADAGCTLAAIVGERELVSPSSRGRHKVRARSDLLEAMALFDEASGASSGRRRYDMGLDPGRVAAVERVRKQLARIVDRRAAPEPRDAAAAEDAALIAILAGWPDRVGRFRRPANATGRATEVVLAGGGTATLAESSVVADTDLVVAIDAEERVELGRPAARGAPARVGKNQVVVRLASAVESDWLLELFTDRIRDVTDVVWNAGAERADAVRRLVYDGLVLEETPGAGDPAIVARALFEAARAKGWRAFAAEGADRVLARLAFARAHAPELDLPAVDEAGVEAALEALCEGRRSFAELRDAGLDLRAGLTPAQSRALAELAPDAVTLPGGRRARIEYPEGQPPFIASRLQDFFGMAAGPRVASGRVPLVLHLLAPNQRAVQVTTDLAGFWARHYPGIAKELRRRYPRHAWPDDPSRASPPAPKR